MLYTYKIATLILNGISSPLVMQMLNNFVLRPNTDITPLQEVTNNDFSPLCGYAALVNKDIDERGTAILLKERTFLRNIKRLPSGKGIAGLFKDTWIMDIYVPSGAEKIQERQTFFTHDLAYLLPASSRDMLIAGGFNCVTSPSDCTGTPNLSKTLSSTIAGLALHDVWESNPQHPPYTHYTKDGATRIDRMCITDPLRKCKQGAETIVAPFTDHFAVEVPLAYSHQTVSRKTRLWKMNISLLEDNTFRDSLMLLWSKWKMTEKYYPNKTSWLDRYVKRRIRQTFQREGSSRNSGRRDMEVFYYAAIHQAVRTPTPRRKMLSLLYDG